MDYIDNPFKTRDSGFDPLPWVNVDCKGYKEPPPPPPPPPPPEMDHHALAAAEEAKAGQKTKEKRRKGRAATILGGARADETEATKTSAKLKGV
jgi:hypothetical protein